MKNGAKMRLAGLAALVAITAAVSCAPTQRLSGVKVADLTKPNLDLGVVILGDNQFNNVMIDVNLIASASAQKLTGTAMRPLQLDVFSPDLLEWGLQEHGHGLFAIHMGDATNVACASEWDEFEKRMMAAAGVKGWVMAPGNHDAYYFGNSLGSQIKIGNSLRYEWAEACNPEYMENGGAGLSASDHEKLLINHVLTKTKFIGKYTNALVRQGDREAKSAGAAANFPNGLSDFKVSKPDADWNGYEWINTNKKGFVQKLYFTLPGGKGWSNDQLVNNSFKSIIIQELLLPAGRSDKMARVFLLDTTNYRRPPAYIGFFSGIYSSILKRLTGRESGAATDTARMAAGTAGTTGESQLAKIKEWIGKVNPVDLYIIAGHHAWRDLDADSQNRLSALMKNLPGVIYISGHSHKGFFKEHYDADIAEFNLASTTDWPAEMAKIGYQLGAGDIPKTLVAERYDLRAAAVEIKKTCEGLAGAKYSRYDEDKYSYGYLDALNLDKAPTALTSFDMRLNTLMYTYHRMFTDLNADRYSEGEAIIDELLERIRDYEECGRSHSAVDNECRRNKFAVVKKAMAADEDLKKNASYKEDRLEYGACQAAWASEAACYDGFKALNASARPRCLPSNGVTSSAAR